MRKDRKKLCAALKKASRLNMKSLGKDLQAQLSIQENKYVEFVALHQIVEEGDLKMLRGTWFVTKNNGGRFLRQQELPEDAFLSSQKFLSGIGTLSIAAISYCWLHRIHPDPNGLHARIIKRALGHR